MEAGLDSISAVELRNAVAARFGIDLPATVTFDYPTLGALATYLAARIGADGAVHIHLHEAPAKVDRGPMILEVRHGCLAHMHALKLLSLCLHRISVLCLYRCNLVRLYFVNGTEEGCNSSPIK